MAAFQSIVSSLLFILITIKINYHYYNVLMSLILIILGLFLALKYTPQVNPKNKERTVLIFIILINLFLLFTPDTAVLKCIHYFGLNNIAWTPNLSWGNFRGQPNQNSPHDARIKTNVWWKVNKVFNYPPAIAVATMNPDSAWKKDYAGGEQLLEHEQGHFNITEVYRRMSMDSANASWGKSTQTIRDIFTHFYHERNKQHHLYDSLTNHGVNKEIQEEWSLRLTEKLR